MIVRNKNQMYSINRKMVHGRGFLDTLSSIGSYISQNKDLLAKPMLGAVGNIGALALTEASRAILRKVLSQKSKEITPSNTSNISPNYQDILNEITKSVNPVGNIVGSGIKKF